VTRQIVGRRLLSLFVMACTACQSPVVPPTAVGPTITGIILTKSIRTGVGTGAGEVIFSSAPTSPVSIALFSNSPAAVVPASVTLPAGVTRTPFGIDATAVSAPTTVTITATFGGSSVSDTLTVTAITANFRVTALAASQRKLPSDANPVVVLPDGADNACPVVNGRLACMFDARASTALTPILNYHWSYFIGVRNRSEETTSPVFQPTEGGTCPFLIGVPSTTTGALQFIPMIILLGVSDSTGASSETARNLNVRIFPQGLCAIDF
jgi:hypothetical protein